MMVIRDLKEKEDAVQDGHVISEARKANEWKRRRQKKCK